VPAGSGSIAGGASFILLAAAPFLVFHLTLGSESPWLAGILATAQITAMAGFFTRNWMFRYRAVLMVVLLAVAAAVMMLPGLPPRSFGLAVAGCCHAAAYLSLLAWFAMSLRSGRQPVVTSFARRVRRTMPDKVVRYTRQVTIAWCVFFAGQLTVSLGLLLLAPMTVWSIFVNLLNLPLLVAMALAEFGYRRVLFRHEPHTSLIDTLSGLRRARFTPATPP
jgi:uncharacterized membrane protein